MNLFLGWLPADILQSYLDKLASGQITLGPTNVYRFDDIRKAPAALGSDTSSKIHANNGDFR